MEKKKGFGKLWIILIAIVLIVLIGLGIYWETTHGNRKLVDTNYRFDYAMIRMPDGSVVEGKVSSWLDYADSDVVQIKINGRTYLTHYSNVVLIDE